jgi:formate hydrogenlyase subunit 3/multisubunit Na+/H+ antiporter MnhD subunit
MNAPTIWIIIPAVIGLILMLITNKRILSLAGGTIAVLLAVTAQFIPIEQALTFGTFSFRIESSIDVLGRTLIITPEEASLLALIWGGTALWFFGAEAAKAYLRLVPLGMLVTSLLVASIAVEPFLYAALFIEMAILLCVPMVTSIYQRPGKGIVRFLIYQTLGMPFILLAGWLLAGVEASPGNLTLAAQSAVVLMLGFAFLLAIFPLYNWIPMLMEELPPFVVGFLLWIIPTTTLIFAAGFIDRYTWLRSSPGMIQVLQFAGLLMLVTGGLWAAFQNHAGRIMAYSAAAETGFSLLALSLTPSLGVPIFFLFFPARALGLAVWSLSLTIIKDRSESLGFTGIRGVLRSIPIAGASLIFASLSTSGFPLLAGFPARVALWDGLARVSLTTAFWAGLGMIGLLTASLRMTAVLSMADEYTSWEVKEGWLQVIMLGLGVTGLFILGLFPQIVQYLFSGLPAMFEHLGQ